MIRSKLLGYT